MSKYFSKMSFAHLHSLSAPYLTDCKQRLALLFSSLRAPYNRGQITLFTDVLYDVISSLWCTLSSKDTLALSLPAWQNKSTDLSEALDRLYLYVPTNSINLSSLML